MAHVADRIASAHIHISYEEALMPDSRNVNVRFGKHPTKSDYRTLRLKNYLTSKLAAPPSSFSILQRVYSALGIATPSVLFPMDGNDTYGDCTIAALAHAATIFKAISGKGKLIMPEAAVEKLYFHLTGGPDTGLNELDVLNYWQSNSVGHERLLAFVKIDPKNHTHIQQAIEIFGGVYLGFQVQANCVQEFRNKQPWTPGPLTNDGHAVFAVGYDANVLTVLTWGDTQQATWAWWDECVDEAYAVLPADAKASDYSPSFDFAQLQADLQQVAG